MIVEDEWNSYTNDFDYMSESENFNVSMPEKTQGHFIRNHARICNSPTNHQLQEDMIKETQNQFDGDEINA